MSKLWKVSCTWECYGTARVEADTLEEACEIAQADEFPLPEGDYIDASFEVDPQMSELLNEE
jgi:hypothetical protein